eukprot:CAMPEP_0184300080 /NCGR_PEP_ID=MMETSP1049-20130417/10575_1 /TAXON_ID=77928 /ORGANISM="Proteomonas sulcata, Strain CCMP704" /LENGTH=242 /DNA_ID=CAMNT_0026610709 /DNA_START=273 /DNA_END=1001 /DNA_ORIENTATION=-
MRGPGEAPVDPAFQAPRDPWSDPTHPPRVFCQMVACSHLCSAIGMMLSFGSPDGFCYGFGLSLMAGEILLLHDLRNDDTPNISLMLSVGVCGCGAFLILRTAVDAFLRPTKPMAGKPDEDVNVQSVLLMAWSFCSWSGVGYLACSLLTLTRQKISENPVQSLGVHLIWISLAAQVLIFKPGGSSKLSQVEMLQHAGVSLAGVGHYWGWEWILVLAPVGIGYLIQPTRRFLYDTLHGRRRVLG